MRLPFLFVPTESTDIASIDATLLFRTAAGG